MEVLAAILNISDLRISTHKLLILNVQKHKFVKKNMIICRVALFNILKKATVASFNVLNRVTRS